MERPFWHTVLKAVETQPVVKYDLFTITGNSTFGHNFRFVGVDEQRDRLVAVVEETTGRMAALIQNDLQRHLAPT
jgi:hypothetical protein